MSNAAVVKTLCNTSLLSAGSVQLFSLLCSGACVIHAVFGSVCVPATDQFVLSYHCFYICWEKVHMEGDRFIVVVSGVLHL